MRYRDHIAFQDNRIEQQKQQFSQACEALGRGVQMKESEHREQVKVALEKLKMEKQYDNRLIEQQCLRAETNSKQVQEAFDSRATIAELKIKEERSNRVQQQQILKESLTAKLDVLDMKVKEVARDLEKNKEEVDFKVSTISINMTGWKKQTKVDLSKLIKQVVLKVERASQRSNTQLQQAVETWNKSLSKVQEVLKAEVKVRQSALEKIQEGFRADTGNVKETLSDFESKLNDTRRTLESSIEATDKALQERAADLRGLVEDLRSDTSTSLLEAKRKLQASVSDNTRGLEQCDKKLQALEKKGDDTDERLRVSIDNCMASQFEGQAQLHRTVNEKLESEVDKLNASIAMQAETEASDRERACEAVAASAQKQLHSRIIATEDKLMEDQDRLRASLEKFEETATAELKEIRSQVEDNKQESMTEIECLTSDLEDRTSSLENKISKNKTQSDKQIEELSSGLDATDKEVMESKKCLRIEAGELKAEMVQALITEREAREASMNSVNERMDVVHGGQEELRDLLGNLRVHIETKISTSAADAEARTDQKLRGLQEEVNVTFEGVRVLMHDGLKDEKEQRETAFKEVENKLEHDSEERTEQIRTLGLQLQNIEAQRASYEGLQQMIRAAEVEEHKQSQELLEQSLRALAQRIESSELMAAEQASSIKDMHTQACSNTALELAVGLTLSSLVSAVCERGQTDSLENVGHKYDEANQSAKHFQLQMMEEIDSIKARADTHDAEEMNFKKRLDDAEEAIGAARRESASERKTIFNELQSYSDKIETLFQSKADGEEITLLKSQSETQKDLIYRNTARLDEMKIESSNRQVDEAKARETVSSNDPQISDEVSKPPNASEDPERETETGKDGNKASLDEDENSRLDNDGSLQSQLLEGPKAS